MDILIKTSVKKIQGQFPKYLGVTDEELSNPQNKGYNFVNNFPKSGKVLFSLGKSNIPKLFIPQYPNPFKKDMPRGVAVKRERTNRQSDLNERLLKLKDELMKRFIDVKNLDHFLDFVLDEINSDKDSYDRFINLSKKQTLVVLSRLLSLRLLQETFKDLNETDKLNFKKEASRETKFG